jgi:hypothetical protein
MSPTAPMPTTLEEGEPSGDRIDAGSSTITEWISG